MSEKRKRKGEKHGRSHMNTSLLTSVNPQNGFPSAGLFFEPAAAHGDCVLDTTIPAALMLSWTFILDKLRSAAKMKKVSLSSANRWKERADCTALIKTAPCSQWLRLTHESDTDTDTYLTLADLSRGKDKPIFDLLQTQYLQLLRELFPWWAFTCGDNLIHHYCN